MQKLDLIQLPDEIVGLLDNVATSDTDFEAFKVLVEQKLLALATQITVVDEASKNKDILQDAEIAAIKASIEEIKKKLEEVMALMAISEAEFQTIKTQTQANTNAIEAILATIEVINVSMISFQEQLDKLNARVTILEGNQLNIAIQNLSIDNLDEDPVLTGIQISKTVTLPSTTSNGGKVTWVSKLPTIISDSGVVTQPTYTEGNQEVTLAATITYGGTTVTKDFILEVIAAAATDIEKVDEDLGGLSLDSLDEDPLTPGIQITTDKVLPSRGEVHSTLVTWSTSDELSLTATGVVTRPTYKETDKVVTLTATLQSGATTKTKTFTITVLKAEPTDAEKVLEAKNALTVGIAVEHQIDLPTKGLYDTNIVWSTSDATVITTTGAVTDPTYTRGDQNVILTATITIGSASATKDFSILVTKLPPTNTEKAQEDLDNAPIPSETDKNIVFPSTGGTHGSDLTWTSNDPAIGADGTITRPSYSEGDKTVIVTGTATNGTDTVTKDFEVVVKFDPTTMTETDKATEDANLIDLTHLDERPDVPGIQISKNLVLPKTSPEYGSTITWTSNNTVYVAHDGTVTRPSASSGNKTVVLTATVKNGTATITKNITIIVLTY